MLTRNMQAVFSLRAGAFGGASERAPAVAAAAFSSLARQQQQQQQQRRDVYNSRESTASSASRYTDTTTKRSSSSPLESSSDVLVLGCGIAGASAALKAAAQGMKVTMLSAAAQAQDCNSYWAQGGIIYKASDDEPRLLAQDVHTAGAGICDDAAVMKLATEGPTRVEEILLDLAKVPFDRNADGSLALCLEASHNRARIIHWRDQTGKAITQAVQAAAYAHPNITVLTGATAVDLAMTQPMGTNGSSTHGRCVGAHVLMHGALHRMRASATVLATGGLGELYAHTSNPASARGDGFAMALRAGAALGNMEYVQFHPTTLRLPGERSFLLTEALRGEGAVLRNVHGEAFAKRYHPGGELAPRDVVSRMIVSEMQRTGADHVFLDITHRDPEWTAQRFPGIAQHCAERGLDMARVPLPVVPAAHYFCGGVLTDLQGRTTLPGLFAAGEVACTGLHGGNRLASTSLLEGLVWGCAIADHLGSSKDKSSSSTVLSKLAAAAESAPLRAPPTTGTAAVNSAAVAAAWHRLKSTMWEHVGVVRTRDGLGRAVRDVTALSATASYAFESSLLTEETVALRNGADTAAAIAQAAAANPRCIGAHYVEEEEAAEALLTAAA
jgi:L-aspartate oxidase